MGELKTEPGWKPPRERKPWWAAAMAAGFGAVLAVLFSLGLISLPARGTEPKAEAIPLRGATFAPLSGDDAAWRERMEKKLDDVLRTQAGQGERLANIEGRLGKH